MQTAIMKKKQNDDVIGGEPEGDLAGGLRGDLDGARGGNIATSDQTCGCTSCSLHPQGSIFLLSS